MPILCAMEVAFTAEIWHWKGPAPFHFVTVPEDFCDALEATAGLVSYGWGMIPVRVRIGATEWETSLFPKDGGFVLPVKDRVRRAEGVEQGDVVGVAFDVVVRAGRPVS